MKQGIRVAEAQEIVLQHVQPLGIEKVPLLAALHRVLATDVVSPRHIPPHDNAAMDGYAVRHHDIAAATPERPVRLPVLEVLPAGKRPTQEVKPGTAIKIMTGAPMPAGADTVVPVEQTNGSDTQVAIYRAPRPGSNLRPRGEDIALGECVLQQHTPLRPAELGLLASVGLAQVLVYQQPRVAILATGDEIADPGDADSADKILNSNSYTLAGQVREAGGLPLLLGVAPDDPEVISQRIASGLRADVLITSGGVSVGDFDYVRACLDKAGLQVHFWTVALRPGSPVTFGTVGQVPVFSLPGNPVASMVTFELFVRPALRKMTGHRELFRPYTRAVLQESVQKRRGVRTFLRGILRQEGEEATVTTTGAAGLWHSALHEPGQLPHRPSRRR
ncbi:MAG: molybdopterin molybdenumtransferase MoeA [Candidatus Tectimicrobiota bacterium]|nr:MAG: molybdopterin molybdenumtransferase MoeA [Candidatus Tectomicrobia bacterium]